MKKLLITIAANLLFVSSAFAATPDVTTNPDEYFLLESQSPDSFKILPPPPAFDSVDFLRDQAHYNAGKSLRDTTQGKRAYNDAEANKDHVANNFTEAFGYKLSKETTPEIYTLITKMQQDAGDLATRSAKRHYNRIRPYSFLKEDTCRPEDQATLSTNGSYPSGHTAVGWAFALVLAEVNPERQNEILQRGYEMGENRVVCGYHWKSDINAARVMASAVVARLHAEPAFAEQMQKAKAEMVRLKK